jgi:hypothetical protein
VFVLKLFFNSFVNFFVLIHIFGICFFLWVLNFMYSVNYLSFGADVIFVVLNVFFMYIYVFRVSFVLCFCEGSGCAGEGL